MISLLAAALIAAGPVTAARPPLQVVSPLPRFLAPGAPFAVRGWAGRALRVRLLIGGRTVDATTSGSLGGFTLRVTAPRPGRYAVAVTAPGERRKVGTLVVRPLVLAAAGDVTFGDAVAAAIASYGPRYPWLSVAPVLRRADLATANLECAVSTRGLPVPNKSFTFRGPPSALDAAADFAGLDVLSVANNHSLDYGRSAFFDTLALVRAAGIASVGGGQNLAAARRPAILSAGGLRLAFLGYSDINPPGFTAGSSWPGTAAADPAAIGSYVRAARRRADLVVVWFHWGIELDRYPDGRQRELATAALNAGATVVLGAHPHVLQPIVRPARGRIVAWSLGNFVFPPHSPGTDRTGVLLIKLGAGGVRGHSFRPATIVGGQPRL
jgi:poly-gamma-glutamate capsule biosynthesis protein CapA/YwtB (metallophosphatase superfamily)